MEEKKGLTIQYKTWGRKSGLLNYPKLLATFPFKFIQDTLLV